MIRRLASDWFLFFVSCLLFSLFCTSHALADRYQDIEDEANRRSENILSSGWINSISPESIIIDDTYYRLTNKTRFLNAKRKFIEGVFIEFELSRENFLATIEIADPQEKDMYMKPIDRSDSKSVNNQVEPQQDGPRLENGIWVN